MRKRRCATHSDQLIDLSKEKCPKCLLDKANETIAELEARVFPEGSVHLGLTYPADRVFSPIMAALNIASVSNFSIGSNATRVIVGGRNNSSGGWYYMVTPELAQALVDVWNKVDGEIKSIEEYAVLGAIRKIQNRVEKLMIGKLLSRTAISKLKKQILAEVGSK